MPNTPFWDWCPKPGASRVAKLLIDQTNYGDGYVHRVTRGLNPVRPSWSLSFPFVGQAELQSMYDFLTANAVRGFWFLPPDGGTETFVVVDEWSAEVTERSIANGITGTLQVTFVRSFNPQPAGV